MELFTTEYWFSEGIVGMVGKC